MPRVNIPQYDSIDLTSLSIKALLSIHNSIAAKPTKKFSDRSTAIRRTGQALDGIGAEQRAGECAYRLPEGYSYDASAHVVRASKASSRTPAPRGEEKPNARKKDQKEEPTDEEVLEGAKEQSPAKGRRLGVCDLIRHYLSQGVPNKEIPELVHAEIPLSRCRVSDVYIVKSKMKKEGLLDGDGNVIKGAE